MLDHHPLQHGRVQGGDYSAANMDNRNVAAQAGGAAAKAAEQGQRIGNGGSVERKKDYDPSVIERIVAEERESKGKLPKYPGLERFRLLEKMGDGAFSNVYRAKDTTGEFDEVAIKVVRKFEMNSTQVRKAVIRNRRISSVAALYRFLHPSPVCSLNVLRVLMSWSLCQQRVMTRATSIYIRISKNNQRLWRCASTSIARFSGHSLVECSLVNSLHFRWVKLIKYFDNRGRTF